MFLLGLLLIGVAIHSGGKYIYSSTVLKYSFEVLQSISMIHVYSTTIQREILYFLLRYIYVR